MRLLCKLLVLVLALPALGDERSGKVFVAATPAGVPKDAATPDLFCRSGNLTFQIDTRSAMPFSHTSSLKLGGFDLDAKHRVVILCDGKAQQSFYFRFSSYKSTELCLFINDLYQTAQLWERKSAPWCK